MSRSDHYKTKESDNMKKDRKQEIYDKLRKEEAGDTKRQDAASAEEQTSLDDIYGKEKIRKYILLLLRTRRLLLYSQ